MEQGTNKLGAIAGDIIGSVFEGRKHWMLERNPDFEPLFARSAKFTDDTVLTIAVADYLLNSCDLVETLKAYAHTYPKAGYAKRSSWRIQMMEALRHRDIA